MVVCCGGLGVPAGPCHAVTTPMVPLTTRQPLLRAPAKIDPLPTADTRIIPNGMLFGIMRVSAVGSGSILAGARSSGCLVVKGTIGVVTAWQGPAGTPSPPQHTTIQY